MAGVNNDVAAHLGENQDLLYMPSLGASLCTL